MSQIMHHEQHQGGLDREFSRYIIKIIAVKMTIMETMYMTCLVLLYCSERIIGTVPVRISSPGTETGISPVCSGGELELTCTITGTVLRWSILIPGDAHDAAMDFTHPIDNESPVAMHVLRVNSIIFKFSRISPPNSQPLISKLLITPANVSINGTEVVCEDRETRNSSLTRMNVVNLNTLTDIVQAVHVVTFISLSEHQGGDHVNLSVSLQLNGTSPYYPYHINIIPESHTDIVVNNATQTIELNLLYDIYYNVSIVACGQSSAPLIGLYYPSKCGTSPIITDYGGYLQESTTITSLPIECPPETSEVPIANCHPPFSPPNGCILPYTSTLEGAVVIYVCSNIHQTENQSFCEEVNVTAICNKEGNWEPDPQDICKGSSFERLSGDGKIAVASSITVFAVSSIVFFFLGYLCGRCNQKHEQSTENSQEQNQQNPMYDDVQPKQHAQLELKTNVAYECIAK